MNKFFNILVAIICFVSMMATAREGSFSSDGFSSSSSYSPSYSSSDWGSSSSSYSSSYNSSDWSWGSSSSSWDDDDDDDDCNYKHSYHNNYIPPVYTYYLYELYTIDYDLAKYYINQSGKASDKDKKTWDYLGERYEKGKEPVQTEDVKEFIQNMNSVKADFEKYEAEQKHAFKMFIMIALIPFSVFLIIIQSYVIYKESNL